MVSQVMFRIYKLYRLYKLYKVSVLGSQARAMNTAFCWWHGHFLRRKYSETVPGHGHLTEEVIVSSHAISPIQFPAIQSAKWRLAPYFFTFYNAADS